MNQLSSGSGGGNVGGSLGSRQPLRPLNNRPASSNQSNQQQQQQQRRKWSDWSECSASCVKTRHRLNCDDILAANSTLAPLIKQQISGSSSNSKNDNQKQSNNLFLSKREANFQLGALDAPAELDPELLRASAEQQNGDDDDYADEVEQEEDSCANVDTSKTFEEVACVGGACQLAQQQQAIAQTATGQQQQTRQRPFPAHVELNRAVRPQPRSSRRPSDHELAKQVAPPPAHEPNLKQLAHEPQTKPNGYADLGTTRTSSPPAAKTGTIWLPQLLWPHSKLSGGGAAAGATENQTATTSGQLIQWTCLIGLALALVLFVMLILRKLFRAATSDNQPSYQWLLAKQTSHGQRRHRHGRRRLSPASGGEGSLPECCRPTGQYCGWLAAASSEAHLAATKHKQHLHHHHPPHHASYLSSSAAANQLAWTGRNQMISFERQLEFAAGGKQQMLASSDGRTMVSHSLATAATSRSFNTDSYADLQPYANPVAFMNNNSAGSNSADRRQMLGSHQPASQRTNCSGSRSLGRDGQLSPDCNYDTVASSRAALDHRHQQEQHIAAQRPQLVGDFCPPDGASSGQRAAFAFIRDGQQQDRPMDIECDQHSQAPPEKHGSPIVPRTGSYEGATSRVPIAEGSAKSSSSSRSSDGSSSSSINSSSRASGSSSASVQSTTAPMLSNAGSFEQAAHFDFEQPVSGQSHEGSPIAMAAVAAPRHNKASLGGPPPQVAQSQPNSPMFANQFKVQPATNNRAAGGHQRHRRMASSALSTPSKLIAMRQAGLGVGNRATESGGEPLPLAAAAAATTTTTTAQVSARRHQRQPKPDCCDNNNPDDDRHFYEEISTTTEGS